ncbi:MAG: hypothetical protein ACREX9_19040 [Gammaproteobacteria bacterium]
MSSTIFFAGAANRMAQRTGKSVLRPMRVTSAGKNSNAIIRLAPA